jgi:hypothetical protein
MTAALDIALAFLRSLHGDAAGLIELRLRPERPGPLADRRFLELPQDVAALAAVLERNSREPSAVLFGVNPRQSMGGFDANVSRVIAAVLDVDGKKLPVDEQKVRLRAVIEHAPNAFAVRSGSLGNGHVYWTFEPSDPEQARALVKRLRTWVCTDPSEPPSKCMRLPGSANWKTGRPVPVEPVYIADPVPRLTLATFAAALDAAGVPLLPAQPAARPRPAPAPRSTSTATATTSTVNVQGVLDALPARIAELARTGATAGYPSRSERDLAVCRALIESGLADTDIADFFDALPIGDKAREAPAAYLVKTIATARSTESPAGQIADVQVQAGGGAMRPGGRAWLTLLVLGDGGPFAGRLISQGITLLPELWQHICKAAGLRPPPLAPPVTMRPLQGRRMRVRLEELGSRLRVSAFLPPSTAAEPSTSAAATAAAPGGAP